MSVVIEQIHDEMHSAWRFRWPALSAAAVLSFIGWAVVFALPDRFEAEAKIFVDTRTALKPVLQGLTMEQDVNAQLNFVRQSLLAGPQLKKVAIETGLLAPTVVDPREEARILQSVEERITITVGSASDHDSERDNAGSIYGLSFNDSSRTRAIKVVDTLLNTFIEQTLGGKRTGSENAQKFLEVQIKDYEQRLRTAEDRLAEFKKNNIGLMPTEQGGYFSQLQTEIDGARKSQTMLSIATSRRAELQRQMRGEAVVSAAGSAPAGLTGAANAGNDTVSRIKETQAKLDDLLLRFTDKHPDVIATRQTLRDLQNRRAAEIDSLRRGDPDAVAASGASNNPVYQSIQVALNQADVEIASIRGELDQHNSKAAELRERLDTAPQVEAEYAQLNRDYDVNKTQYSALLANYQKAKLGEQADNAGSVRFEIVSPPSAAFAPVFPRRVVFLSAVLLGSFLVGGGLAYLLHRLRPVVGSARGLTQLTGLPVLAVVSPAFPSRMHQQARSDVLTFSFAMACLLACMGTVLVLNNMGLRVPLATLNFW
jgi:polysaccharide chain length determinant protein (PEP-CTERM system associated)